jgi:hypothetical protein
MPIVWQPYFCREGWALVTTLKPAKIQGQVHFAEPNQCVLSFKTLFYPIFFLQGYILNIVGDAPSDWTLKPPSLNSDIKKIVINCFWTELDLGLILNDYALSNNSSSEFFWAIWVFAHQLAITAVYPNEIELLKDYKWWNPANSIKQST